MNRQRLLSVALMSIGCSVLANEFFISSRSNKKTKVSRVSKAKLKEELAYSCEQVLKEGAHGIDLLMRYQRLVLTQSKDAQILGTVADFTQALVKLTPVSVNCVKDLANGSCETCFGKADKKKLAVYAQLFAQLVDDIHQWAEQIGVWMNQPSILPFTAKDFVEHQVYLQESTKKLTESLKQLEQ